MNALSIWSFHNAASVPRKRSIRGGSCSNIVLNNLILDYVFGTDIIQKVRIDNAYDTRHSLLISFLDIRRHTLLSIC
jgi:hypothetical protein